ncbi:unnamed protein product [Parajaminaea phylloscopi]
MDPASSTSPSSQSQSIAPNTNPSGHHGQRSAYISAWPEPPQHHPTTPTRLRDSSRYDRGGRVEAVILVMDPQALLQLLSDSTKRLSCLHSELGHEPSRLEEDIASLHTTLHAAIEGQLQRVQAEVDSAKQTLTSTAQRIKSYTLALTDDESSSPAAADTEIAEPQDAAALLPRVAKATSQLDRLKHLYDSRRQQADKLSTELASFEPILGSFVPRVRPGVSSPKESATSTDSDLTPLPTAYLTQLSSAIDKCGHELTRRSEELQLHLYEILGLWSELCLPPDSNFCDNDDSQVTFDDLVLRHLRLQTAWEEVQLEEGGPTTLEFQGTFLPVETGSEEGPMHDTPSRSGGSTSAKLHSTRTAETHFPPHVLQPTAENIAQAQAKRDWLEMEKGRREGRIQELYDELFSLWVKFDVPEDDMDKFVMGNSGSTMAVIEAYEAELVKMRELKQQHMALFVGKVRERIENLWMELRLGDEQKEITFPAFFQSLEGMSGSQLDELLAQHEERISELEAEVEKKAPLLKLVGRYFDLCEEERQLEESAKDTTRLMKGVRGDPGRLLREEKMRKRVKIQKPKLEAELLKAIPAWEAESGQTFTIDGEAYYGKILALSGNAAAHKRARVASVATPVSHGSGVLQHSSARGNGVASTPLRTPSAAPGAAGHRTAGTASAIASSKKPRLVPKGQTPGPQAQHAAPRPATNVGTLVARVPPADVNPTRLASSSRIPMPASPPKAHSSQFAGAKNAAAAIARVSTSGYQAGHNFRPRPSQLARAASGVPHGHRASQGGWTDHGGVSGGLPRNMSGASIASDATTLCYPATNMMAAYAQAIPARVNPVYSAHVPPAASNGKVRTSVNQGKTRRGPSMGLEGALASLAAAGYPQPRSSADGPASTIRTVSSEVYARTHEGAPSSSEAGGGANWAVLEEDEGEDGQHYGQQNDMEVF